ncbi:GID complex subunit 4, VID24 [Coemansia sp. RSA 2607]|nr:GID complex subunit 4, VID24 [Coemansia sp. RSA 2607]
MPVITHRRVNEMRSGRRRLSVGAVGGYNTGMSPTGGGSSPRTSTYGILSRYGSSGGSTGSECKPGAAAHSPSMPRRLSPRPQLLLQETLTTASSSRRKLSAATSSGLPSPSSSPTMMSVAHAPESLSESLPSSAASHMSPDGRIPGASLVDSGSNLPRVQITQNLVMSAAGGQSLAPAQEGLAGNDDASSGKRADGRGCVRFPEPVAIPGSKSSAVGFGITADNGMYSPPADEVNNVRQGAHAMAGSDTSDFDDSDSDIYMEAECGYSSDDEARADPLPTPEQLIFSQTWSTWPTPCHHLYSGSQFTGSQSNGTRSYVVTVSLKYVDMAVPELCGHFTIRGLTNDLPTLTTYFDAQIVGSSAHSFVTNQWDATVDTDRTHWSFFPAFMQYRNHFDAKDFGYKLSLSDKYIYMRWKERFVVPNYKLSRINGASYDGFYYVCYDREAATITGYYYHRDSDHYQCLKLNHAEQTTFSHYELA